MLFNKNFISILIICAINFGFNIANNNICSVPEQSDEVTKQQVTNEPCFDIQQYEYNLNKKAQQEKSVEFECFVKNKGSLSVAWLHDNQLISLNDQVLVPDSNIQLNTDSSRKFNLKIKNLDLTHKGSYRCQIIAKNTKNLEYILDILVPPSITRIPNNDVIVLSEGESLTIQCITQGNPRPKLTWSKTGEKPVHTSIDELKSTLTLKNVDETHTDTYSCTAKNDVGNPVTSEFQVLVKFKPRVKISEDVNVHNKVMYSVVGKKEQIKCLVSAYPVPKMSLYHNNILVPSQSYTFEETKLSNKQFVLTYNIIASAGNFGDYKCVAENELGSSSDEIKITPLPCELQINGDKLPIYSDAVVFEWSVYSGSPIQELNVQVFSANSSNISNIVTKTKQLLSDGSESYPTYHNENVLYKDYYDLTKLVSNTSYVLRLRVRNEYNEWSQWSQNLTVKTHSDDNEKLLKHRSSQMHHHKQHHERKHKQFAQQTGSRDLNGKRERFNSYLYDMNSGNNLKQTINRFSSILTIISVLYKFTI